MTDPERREDEAVDRLVRAHLERAAERTDATKLFSRIREGPQPPARFDGASPTVRHATARLARRWPGSLGWSAVAAAMVVGAFLGGRYFHPSAANAATILRQTRVAHERGVDRCYRVHYAPDPRYWDGKNVLAGPSESVLWTRGDRFWSDCSIGRVRLTIGRDEDRAFWISPSRKKGIRFAGEGSQLPKEVAVLCDVNSLTVPALMDDVLVDFDLSTEGPAPNGRGASSVVWARPKPGRSHPLISAALLEVDGRGGDLLRLVLWITREGRPNGTVTYTLIEAATRSDEEYRLESHLDPDAQVEVQRFKQPGVAGPKAGP